MAFHTKCPDVHNGNAMSRCSHTFYNAQQMAVFLDVKTPEKKNALSN